MTDLQCVLVWFVFEPIAITIGALVGYSVSEWIIKLQEKRKNRKKSKEIDAKLDVQMKNR